MRTAGRLRGSSGFLLYQNVIASCLVLAALGRLDRRLPGGRGHRRRHLCCRGRRLQTGGLPGVGPVVPLELAQDLLLARIGRLPRRRHRALVAAADVCRQLARRLRQVLAGLLARGVDRAGHAEDDPGGHLPPGVHSAPSPSGLPSGVPPPRLSPARNVLMPRERPAVAEETFMTPPRTPRVMTVVVWSSSSVMPATSPTASSSWESWLFMLSTVVWVLPMRGTTCSETSFIDFSVVEKILASRRKAHASRKNATATPAYSKPFISSTKRSKSCSLLYRNGPRTRIITGMIPDTRPYSSPRRPTTPPATTRRPS